MPGRVTQDGGPKEPGPDEIYCTTCGEIILKKAEICPECGVRNELAEPGKKQSDKTNSGWYLLFIGTIIGWVLAILVIGTVGNPFRGDPNSSAGMLLGLVLLISWVGMPVAGYFDIQYVKNHTDWDPTTALWVFGFFIWFLNIILALFYLNKRRSAFSN